MTHSELRAQVAFRLTGLRAQGSPAASLQLRPALAARHGNLANLRYDFPLVLPAEPSGREFAVPLCTIVDRLLDAVAPAGEGDGLRLRRSVLKLEREIRVAVAHGASGTLRSLWDLAASRLCVKAGAHIAEDLSRALRALKVDGEVVDCDGALPARFLLQAWKSAQKAKAASFNQELQRLIHGLAGILAADEARSPQSRSAQRLRQAVGSLHRDEFDFDAMSRLMGRSGAWRPLTEARRRRIRTLLVGLESQRFFMDDSGYTFVFDRCAPALRTFRARYPRLRALARSMAMARLEVEGSYVEQEHDELFKHIKEHPVAPEELARFPDYLVCLRESALDGSAREELLDLLSSGIPVKVLVQSDDLLEEAAASEGLAAVSAHADAIAGAAIGLGDVFVLQASASHLPKMTEPVSRAFAHPGAALFNVFSGATGDSAALPAYLNAAAAMESRAFPAFTYDPSAANAGEPGFAVEGNAQADRDWPVHGFEYEDAAHQRASRELPFTVADFIACDDRLAAHFMPVSSKGGKFAPVPAWLDGEGTDDEQTSPSIAMVDQKDVLHEVVVDDFVIGLARRARDRWRRLQRWSSRAAPAARIEAAPVVEEAAPASAPAVQAPPAAAAPPPAQAAESGEPYIETPRCTTCEECIQVNNRMFAYDGNKQAYIADLKAGTYRQLVEAAENCQVSIIHPGKPTNPDEPGLPELVERAAAFN